MATEQGGVDPSKPKAKRKVHRAHAHRHRPYSSSTSDARASETTTANQRQQQQPNRQQHHTPRQAAPVSTPLYSFDSASSSWSALDDALLPVAPSQTLTAGSTLSCLTYNTWSSAPTHSPFQTQSLLRTLHKAASAGVSLIGLQEVTPEFEAALCGERWLREDWAISSAQEYITAAGPGKIEGGSNRWGGGPKVKEGGVETVLLLVRKTLLGRGSSLKLVKMDIPRGDRGRALVLLDLHQHHKLALRVATAHYTALPVNHSFRKRQFDLTIRHLFNGQPRAPSHIILADTNASAEAELAPFRAFYDAFRSSPFCPVVASTNNAVEVESLFSAGPTFGHLYPWVPGAPRKKPRKPRRIDRVWVKGLEVVRYEEHGGKDPVREQEGGQRMRDREGRDGWMWESDHVAVQVTVRLPGGRA